MLSSLYCDITAWHSSFMLKDKHWLTVYQLLGCVFIHRIAFNVGYNIKDCFKVIQYSNGRIQLISTIV